MCSNRGEPWAFHQAHLLPFAIACPCGRYDIGGPNHVRLPYNKCGCVYSLSVRGAGGTLLPALERPAADR